MRSLKRAGLFAYVLIAVLLLDYQRAYAYLDPGTGSYILQIIMAGILGGLLALKVFWRNLRGFFANIFSKKSDVKPDQR